MLSNIFLKKVGRALDHIFVGNTKQVFKYVHDYFVFIGKVKFRTIKYVLRSFTKKV